MSTPAVVKLVHTFENHEHEVCSSKSTEHFHEFEVDCEFSNFNLNPQLRVDLNIQASINYDQYFKCTFEFSDLITSRIILISTQRGPPFLV